MAGINIPPSYKVPGLYVDVQLGVGAQSPLSSPREAVLIDYGLAGPYNEMFAAVNADAVALRHGSGSHLHLGAAAFFKENKVGVLWVLRLAEASGGVAATRLLAASGNSSSDHTLFADINGMTPYPEVRVTRGMGAYQQLVALVALVNAHSELPCTGTVNAAAVTVGGVVYYASQAGITATHTSPGTYTPLASVGVASGAITVTLAWGGYPTDIGTGLSGVRYTAKGAGVTVQHVDPGTNASLSVGVTGSAITVNLAYATGAVTSTAEQVRAAVFASTAAMALLEAVANTLQPGSGLVAGMGSPTTLPAGIRSTQAQVAALALGDTVAGPLLSDAQPATPPGSALATAGGPTTLVQPGAVFTWKQHTQRSEQFKLRLAVDAPGGTTFTITNGTAGSGEGDPTTVLAAIGDRPVKYVVTGVDGPSTITGLPVYATAVQDRSGPFLGRRCCLVAATIGTYGQAVALATAVNAHRGQVAWCRNADDTTVELAARMCALRSVYESVDPAANMDSRVFAALRAPASQADYVQVAEAALALNNGLTAIGISTTRKGYVYRSITTRFQDQLGGPDYRTLDTTKQVVPDYIADVLALGWVTQGFQNWKLRDDADEQHEQELVATPKVLRDWILGDLYQADRQNILTHVEDLAPQVVVVLADQTASPGRAMATVPVDPIEGLHQLLIEIDQVG